MGASAYDIIVHYQHDIQGQSIVEIGTSRGEGSTNFFINYTQQSRQNFYTVDVRSKVIDYYNSKHISHVLAINDEQENFENLIKPKVCFAYLDSFDYIPPDDSINHQWMKDMIEDYKNRNPNNPELWLTNENSARHHLEITQRLLPLMSDQSIFLFDDTFIPATLQHVGWFKNAYDPNSEEYTSWQGKGATAVPFLMKNGWKVLPRLQRPGRDDYVALSNF